MRKGVLILLYIIVLLGLVTNCGRGSGQADLNHHQGSGDLTQFLHTELGRLGIDPDRHPAAAPSGDECCVFNAAAYATDPDGAGGDLPSQVSVVWVERFVGDYDQNGEVNIADLTPLGMRINGEVSYDLPGQHLGNAQWPTGNPLDDGEVPEGDPAADGSAAANWRLARIDGDGNGQLNINDVTPIAQHWNERLDGYRVYRKRPEDAGFVLLPNPDDAGLQYSATRAANTDPSRPVRYVFADTDTALAEGGIWQYYVTPYDATNDQEGEPSNIAYLNIEGGEGGAGIPPVAVITPEMNSVTAPQSIMLSAEGSYDPDGTVTGYEWNLPATPGIWINTGLIPVMSAHIATPGTHLLQVRVSDDSGRSSTATCKVCAAESEGNLPPAAFVSADTPMGDAPFAVTFNAGGSYDLDGTLANFAWDTDGNPLNGYEHDSGTTPTYSRQFTTGGVYEQWVQVTDDDDATDEAMVTVSVIGADGNIPPVAALTADTTDADAPFTVILNAAGTIDIDGQIDRYEWDTDGDGITDIVTQDPFTTAEIDIPGTYKLQVIATDDDGAGDTCSLTIQARGWMTRVVEAPGPDQSIGTRISCANIRGVPAIAYRRDLAGIDNELVYRIAGASDGMTWREAVTVLSGAGAGSVVSDVKLLTVNGNPAIASYNQLTDRIEFRRALDTDGDSWPAEPVVVEATSNCTHLDCAVVNGHPAISYRNASLQELVFCWSADENGDSWPYHDVADDSTGCGYYAALVETTNGFPFIAHRYETNEDAYFSRSQTSTGSDWYAPTLATPDTTVIHNLALCIVEGRPAMAYYGQRLSEGNGLFFVRADDSTGTNWGSTATLIWSGLNNGKYASMHVIDGRPAIAFQAYDSGDPFLSYIRADTADGSGWGFAEIVDETRNSGLRNSLAEVAHHPVIAYHNATTGELLFAYRH